MRNTTLLVSLTTLLATPLVIAQAPIQWESNTQRGIDIAEHTQRPLLFHVPGDDDGDDSGLEDAQDLVFRDERVRTYVGRRFVPVRLPRSLGTERLLRELDVSARFGLIMVVVTPNGELVGRIDPGDATTPRRFLEELAPLFRKYRNELFASELKPRLTTRELDASEVSDALEKVNQFVILDADDTLVELLDHPDLRPLTRTDVYATLATLSTEASIQALLAAAHDNDGARDALAECTPAGAERMLPAMRNDRGNVRPYVYAAVAEICELDTAKSKLFWRTAAPSEQQAELSRVSDRVEEVAERWKEQIGELR